jgi:hypothetical protein
MTISQAQWRTLNLLNKSLPTPSTDPTELMIIAGCMMMVMSGSPQHCISCSAGDMP